MVYRTKPLRTEAYSLVVLYLLPTFGHAHEAGIVPWAPLQLQLLTIFERNLRSKLCSHLARHLPTRRDMNYLRFTIFNLRFNPRTYETF